MTAPAPTAPRSALRREDGNAAIIAILVLTLMLILTGTAFTVSQQLGGDIQRTSNAQKAFQAAEAGVDRALARINSYRPAAGQCVTEQLATPVGGWCAATTAETLGQGVSFTYRVSSSSSPVAACGGVGLPANATGDRCIVSTGTANGVTRRVAARVAIATTTTVFSNSTSIVGYKEIRIKKRASVQSNVSVNKKLQVEKDAVLTGTATLGPKAKVKGWSGATTRLTTPLVPTLPDFAVFDPSSGVKRDSAMWNDNLSAVAPWAGTGKVVYDATKRELTVGDGVTLTLPPGVYNFCRVTLGKNARVSIVPPLPGATVPLDAVRLFMDSRDRAGSRCAGDGKLDSRTGSSFVNASNDPRTFQLFAWSKRSNLKIGNASAFSGIIVAPNSKVKFNGKGKLTGGITGRSVEIRKEMQVVWSPLLDTWTVPDSGISQVVSWRQCTGRPQVQPYDGCPLA